jgi:glucan phosphoethanolaminetransferase (alkaline phosphatase superfamily)
MHARNPREARLLAPFLFFGGLSLLYNLLYNSHFLGLWAEGDLLCFAAFMATSWVMVLGLLLTLALNRALFAAALPFLFLVSAVTDYFISTYEIKLFGLNTVAYAFETSFEEASGFMGEAFALRAGASVALGAAAVALAGRQWGGIPLRGKAGGILACLVVSAAVNLAFEIPKALPFNLVNHTVSYAVERHRLQRLADHKMDITALGFSREDEDLTLVLVIGESARSDHFHANGYHRQTTPRVEELGALAYKDVLACGISTRTAVPCMLTRATPRTMEVASRERSFISVFRRAGFHTAWISNQKFLGKANTLVSSIAREAEAVVFNNKQADNVYMKLLDEDLLDPLREALGHPNPRKLIVLHTVGSHWLYDNHYPEAFRVFMPVCTERSQRSCSLEEVVNAYDNSILYTDLFLSEVIRAVAGARSLVFYVSDHGESLGEKRRYGHGQGEDLPEQRLVPMLVWSSPAYGKAFPGRVNAMGDHLGKSLTHDHLFHSVLDCAGFSSAVVDWGLSICSAPA